MDWLPLALIILMSLDNLLTFTLVVTFFKKYLDTKIRAVQIITIFFLFDGLMGIAELVALILNPENLALLYLNDSQLFPILFSILGIVGAGIFLIFIDSYVSENLPSQHLILFAAILSSFLTFSFLKLFNINSIGSFANPNLSGTPLSFDFLPAIMITYLIVVAYPKLNSVRTTTVLERQKRSVEGLMVALFFLFVIPAIFITTANMGDFPNTPTIILGTLIPRLGVLIGSIVLLITYGLTSPAYLHNQQLEKLLVITKTGTPLYSLEFVDNTDQYQKDDVLISGSLAALGGLLAETISVSDLEVIEFKEKEVLIEHHDKIGFFLITDRPSTFLWNALRSTAVTIIDLLDLEINQISGGEMLVDPEIDTKVKKIFGVI